MLAGLGELSAAPVVPPPGAAAARIREAVLNGDGSFIAEEHTLNHYRDEMWAALYFRCDTRTRSEREILDQCHAEYRRRVAEYQAASRPADVIREMERILRRAEAALL